MIPPMIGGEPRRLAETPAVLEATIRQRPSLLMGEESLLCAVASVDRHVQKEQAMNRSTGSRSPARTRLGLAVLICAALVAGAGAGAGSAAPMASSPVASALDDVPEARAAALSLAQSHLAYAGVSTASSTDGAPAVTFYFAGRDTNRDAEVLSLLPPDLRSNARIVVVEHSLVDLTDSKDRVFARVSRESAIKALVLKSSATGCLCLPEMQTRAARRMN